jgi:NAD(P)-dependent dehydrogenase (short-subunit alcohol dehydrogenase family)
MTPRPADVPGQAGGSSGPGPGSAAGQDPGSGAGLAGSRPDHRDRDAARPPGRTSPADPGRRLGLPGEVADLALALALAILRNAYLTYRVISLDGGRHPR